MKCLTLEEPVLEFPAWLYGTTASTLRKVRAEGKWWAREHLETGAFPQPRQLRQAPKKFESLSSAYTYTVAVQLAAWDRQLALR